MSTKRIKASCEPTDPRRDGVGAMAPHVKWTTVYNTNGERSMAKRKLKHEIDMLSCGTWNVRTLLQQGNLENAKL